MQTSIRNRVKINKDFLKTENLTEREKNLLRGEIGFLEDLLDMCSVGIEFKEKDTLNFEAWKELRYKMISKGLLECKSTKTWKMLDDVFYEYKKEKENQLLINCNVP